MKLRLYFSIFAVLFALPFELFACDYSFYPWLSPSLLDLGAVPEPVFQYRDPTDPDSEPVDQDLGNMTDEEWRDYFKSRKNKNYTLRQMRKMLEDSATGDAEVDEYLVFLDKAGGDCDNNRKAYDVAVQKACDHKLSSFLRAKYAYHTVRMAVLAEKWDLGIANYNKLFAPLGVATLVRYEAMGWLARAFNFTKQPEKAVSLYADMYDQCPAMNEEALKSLKMINDAEDLLGSLANHLKPGHRRITALYLKHEVGGRDYSASTLSEATKYGAGELQVKKMLMQMIRDVEKDQFVARCPNLLGEPDFIPPKNSLLKFLAKAAYQKPAFADLVPVCEKAAASHKERRPAFWYWGASYLALLSGDTKTAREDLDKALKTAAKDTALAPSLHLQETLVEMAESPKTFSPALQSRFVKDLAWATQKEVDAHKPGYYLNRFNPGPKMEDTLWALAIQKYIYTGDWARACLMASAVAPPPYLSNDKIDLSLFLDFATPDELAGLKALLKKKRLPGLSPLEKLALEKTTLVPKDMDLLLMLRKANQFDYAGAFSDLNSSLAKDPAFLQTQSNPVTNDYGYSKVDFYKGTSIPVKSVRFAYDFQRITGDSRTENLDLLAYIKLMKSLTEKLEEGRKGNKALEVKSAFDLGRIYATEQMTGWPEFRSATYMAENRFAFNIHTESCPLYFMGAPLEKERRKRFNEFTANTPDYHMIASQYFQEVVDAKGDKELTAQSLAYLMGLNYVHQATYSKMLWEKYRATEFYKRYATVCSLLQPLVAAH